MGKDEVNPGDVVRILIGDAPPIFLLEVFLRTLIVYVFFLMIMRWLGKRMAGQLTFVEMAVMLTLGAIVAPAMQSPDKGILLGIFILTCTLFFQKGLTWLTYVSWKVHSAVQGKVSCLAKDGVLDLTELKKARISRQQLFANLREKSIFNLGQVERVYIEAYGEFSVYERKEQKPGLIVFPGKGNLSGIVRNVNGQRSCTSCGYTTNKPTEELCPVCNKKQWVDAIIANDKG